jgi:hypothetical protein
MGIALWLFDFCFPASVLFLQVLRHALQGAELAAKVQTSDSFGMLDSRCFRARSELINSSIRPFQSSALQGLGNREQRIEANDGNVRDLPNQYSKLRVIPVCA